MGLYSCEYPIEGLSIMFYKESFNHRIRSHNTNNLVFKWLDVTFNDFDSIMNLFDHVDDYKCGTNKTNVIDAIVATSVWYIWRFCNNKAF